MSDDTLQAKVGGGFSLVMELEDRSKLKELMERLGAPQTRPRIQKALASLDYVHYSRFLPLWEHGLLLIVTEFDGAMQDYVMDFAAVLDDEFSMILSYMKERPRLPVSKYPDEFWAYVASHTRPKNPALPAYADPFSAYPGKSVLDIVGPGKRKSLPALPALSQTSVDFKDVQANMLRGFHARHAVHLGLRFPDAAQGRKLIGTLIADDLVRVTPAEPWPDEASYCLNVGFTHAGLGALGLPANELKPFPTAYREGPVVRAKRLGDEGDSAPQGWRVGGVDAKSGVADEVHALVSLYAKKDGAAIDGLLGRLRMLFDSHSVEAAVRAEAHAFDDDPSRIHFGYRDGIAQPRVAGVRPEREAGGPPLSPPGDFLLGPDYMNARGGFYIGELRPDLAQNATYAAFRVIEQKVHLFESLLEKAAQEHRLDPELVAAKLMGRWRDGSPLVVWPDEPAPSARERTAAELDDFDYVNPPGPRYDQLARLCPAGAHIRRFNPRGGLVLGVPWGRRIIRRGMPYGPPIERGQPEDSTERGLVGLFICGDLESQFEFLLRAWGQGDLSAHGLRGTQDPFTGTRAGSTPFRFHPSASAEEITIDIPPLTRTAGSLYLLMPGLRGLRWIASAGWQ